MKNYLVDQNKKLERQYFQKNKNKINYLKRQSQIFRNI